jgi:hypothetical protein
LLFEDGPKVGHRKNTKTKTTYLFRVQLWILGEAQMMPLDNRGIVTRVEATPGVQKEPFFVLGEQPPG